MVTRQDKVFPYCGVSLCPAFWAATAVKAGFAGVSDENMV